MTREVSQWAREQLMQARQRKECQRQRLRVAVAFHMEDLEGPLPTVIAMPAVASTATALSDAEPTGTTHVCFATSTSDALLTQPDAAPAMSQLTIANATHSQFHRHDAPTLWLTFVEGVQSLSTTSLLLSTQQLPALTVKKPLRFRQPKKEWRVQAKRGPLWRCVLDNKGTMEDKCHAKEEALALLGHNIPVTCHALRDFLTTSGPTSHHDTSLSTSGTMARKSQPSTLPSK